MTDPRDPTLLVNIFAKEHDMGRHASDNPASEQIRIRCTPEDKAAVRNRAEAAGVTMSEYLLRCALPAKEPRLVSE